MEPHRKGDLTESIVITELKKRDIGVSIPFGNNERYDVIVESDTGELYSAQIKSGWVTDGVIKFHAKTQHTNSQGNTYKPYEGDVDLFLVYCEETDGLYLVWEDEFNSSLWLRVEEPEMHHRTINWAEDFEFDRRWPPEDTEAESGDSTTNSTC